MSAARRYGRSALSLFLLRIAPFPKRGAQRMQRMAGESRRRSVAQRAMTWISRALCDTAQWRKLNVSRSRLIAGEASFDEIEPLSPDSDLFCADFACNFCFRHGAS